MVELVFVPNELLTLSVLDLNYFLIVEQSCIGQRVRRDGRVNLPQSAGLTVLFSVKQLAVVADRRKNVLKTLRHGSARFGCSLSVLRVSFWC